jgi:tRNA(Ile)-lysidine synthase
MRAFEFRGVCGRSEEMPIEKSAAKPDVLKTRVRRTICEHGMIVSGDHVVVAVSGGADSVALLLCLLDMAPELHFSITVAHLNHGFRREEGDADESFVRTLSADLGLPFVSESIDVKGEAAATKQNMEELARQKRYDFLNRTASRVKAQKIAVGHTLNDQAETALFRFIRGSGMEGLSSIYPVVGGRIIRPLLDCSREDIVEYLRQRGAQYREDSTNKDLRYSRNRIRLELMPYLQKNFNPRLARTLARETALARETWSLLESQAHQAFAGLHRAAGNGIALNAREILKLHPALQKQVLRFALRQCLGNLRGIAASHTENLVRLCSHAQSGDQIRMPHGAIAIRQFDEVFLLRQEFPSCPDFCYQLSVPGRCYIAAIKATISATICRVPLKSITQKHPNQAFLEPAVLPDCLTIRSRLPGDRYGGPEHRKVKKMLIDRTIPLMLRETLPMIAAGEAVIWMPGFKPAPAYAAHPDSETFVMLEFSPDNQRESVNSVVL